MNGCLEKDGQCDLIDESKGTQYHRQHLGRFRCLPGSMLPELQLGINVDIQILFTYLLWTRHSYVNLVSGEQPNLFHFLQNTLAARYVRNPSHESKYQYRNDVAQIQGCING